MAHRIRVVVLATLIVGLVAGSASMISGTGASGRTTSLTAPATVAATATRLGAAAAPTHEDAAPSEPIRAELDHVDVTGAIRTIRVELRLPDRGAERDPASGSAAAPLPVVIWSHGGSTGFRQPDHVADRWGRAFNEAGIAVVAIAHPARGQASWDRLCAAVGAAECTMFNPLTWDRPHDLVTVIDWVEERADDLHLDPDRIVVGGHSAGSSGVLHLSGMGWNGGSELAPPVDDRPVAVIAASPPDAMARGLDDDSMRAVEQPLLMLTGAGDTTSGSMAEGRRSLLDLLPDTADAALLWLDDDAARHGLFNLNVDACRRGGGTVTGCRHAARTIADVAIQFVLAVTSAPAAFGVDQFVERVGNGLPPRVTLEAAGG